MTERSAQRSWLGYAFIGFAVAFLVGALIIFGIPFLLGLLRIQVNL